MTARPCSSERPRTAGRVDTDRRPDIYQRAGGTTTAGVDRICRRQRCLPVFYRGSSSATARAAFFSPRSNSSPATPTPRRTSTSARAAATSLLSTGPAGGNGALRRDLPRHDGERARRSSSRRRSAYVAPTPTARSTCTSAPAATTTLLSTGPAGGNGAFDARFKAASQGGSRVFFQTAERLVSATPTVRSTCTSARAARRRCSRPGRRAATAPVDALLQDVSGDGAHGRDRHRRGAHGADTDIRFDVYSRSVAAPPRCVIDRPRRRAYDAYFDGMSRDGSRVFFETLEQLTDDTDVYPDVYERFGGVTIEGLRRGHRRQRREHRRVPGHERGRRARLLQHPREDGQRRHRQQCRPVCRADQDRVRPPEGRHTGQRAAGGGIPRVHGAEPRARPARARRRRDRRLLQSAGPSLGPPHRGDGRRQRESGELGRRRSAT